MPLAIDALSGAVPVIVLLAALFLFAEALRDSGALDHLARWLVARAPRPEWLPAVVFLGFGVASPFLVNDALVVIGVPLLLAVAAGLRLPPKPLLLTLAFAVTVGSTLTPIGNPQNLLVALDSGIGSPFLEFLRYLALPTAVNLVAGAAYLHWRFRRSLRSDPSAPRSPPREPVRLIPPGGFWRTVPRRPVVVLFPAAIVAMVLLDADGALAGLSVPIWVTAGLAALLLLAVSPRRPRIVRRINWEILLLFAGLFVVVAGVVHGGLLASVLAYAPLPGPSRPITGLAAITATSAVGPQLVSNVPWVALEIPVLSAAGYSSATPVAWLALAAASTLAGNATLLGAASNLITVDLAERAGTRIGLAEFVRDGLPIAAISLAVLFALLALGL